MKGKLRLTELSYVCFSPGLIPSLASNFRCFSRPLFPERLCNDSTHHGTKLSFCDPKFVKDIVLYFRCYLLTVKCQTTELGSGIQHEKE